MNKLAPLFAATMIALSGAALAQDDDASPAQPDASQGQEAQPKAFVLIQRNIYVPVDAEGKVASQNWIVIDKQGVITAEEMEKAASEAATSESTEGESGGNGASEQAKPSVKGRPAGEGPIVRS